jgi:hypothetical protein
MGFSGGDHVTGSTFDAAGLAAVHIPYTFTDMNGCTNSADAIVTVNALPIVTADPKSVCIGSTVLLGSSRWGLEW